jgi:hypothetical protein
LGFGQVIRVFLSTDKETLQQFFITFLARLSELRSTLIFDRITLVLHDMESIKNNIRMRQPFAL